MFQVITLIPSDAEFDSFEFMIPLEFPVVSLFTGSGDWRFDFVVEVNTRADGSGDWLEFERLNAGTRTRRLELSAAGRYRVRVEFPFLGGPTDARPALYATGFSSTTTVSD